MSNGFSNEYREQHTKKIILNVGSNTFDQLEQGLKTMEMRLKKENRIKISVGDIIIFKLQTGEDQRPEDEVSCEKKVIREATYTGLDSVLKNEPLANILPGKPNKEDFLKKALIHYKKAAKGIDIYTSEFEVIEFQNII